MECVQILTDGDGCCEGMPVDVDLLQSAEICATKQPLAVTAIGRSEIWALHQSAAEKVECFELVWRYLLTQWQHTSNGF